MAKDVAKPRSIKVSDAMWARWQEKAKAAGKSVAAFIIDRMEPPASAVDQAAHHVSGPVLADPVPPVAGTAVGFNLKGPRKSNAKR